MLLEQRPEKRWGNGMKVQCTQCGAEQVVLESDFFLRCPFCDSRIVVDPPKNTPAIVQPSVSKEYITRLFPSSAVKSMEINYFPYLENTTGSGGSLKPCFNQPWQELDSYVPPAGDRKVFDPGMAEPDQIIPFDRESEDDTSDRIVFHPFYVVMLRMEGYSEGLLVDAVSGRTIGDIPGSGGDDSEGGGLFRLFFVTLGISTAVSVPLYIISKGLDIQMMSRIWTFVLVIALVMGFYLLRTGRGR